MPNKNVQSALFKVQNMTAHESLQAYKTRGTNHHKGNHERALSK